MVLKTRSHSFVKLNHLTEPGRVEAEEKPGVLLFPGFGCEHFALVLVIAVSGDSEVLNGFDVG